MNNETVNNDPNKITLQVSSEQLKGNYSNIMQIQHTKEEFCIDFFSVFPPNGVLNNRVIISPGHLKRMITAMQDNLLQYEKSYGNLNPAPEPEKSSIGF